MMSPRSVSVAASREPRIRSAPRQFLDLMALAQRQIADLVSPGVEALRALHLEELRPIATRA